MGFKEHYKEMNESKGIFNTLTKGEIKDIEEQLATWNLNEMSISQYDEDEEVIVVKNAQKEIYLRGFKDSDVKEAILERMEAWYDGVIGAISAYKDINDYVMTDLIVDNRYWKKDGLVKFLKEALKSDWGSSVEDEETSLDFDSWLKDIYGFNDFKDDDHLNEYMENNPTFYASMGDNIKNNTTLEDVQKLIQKWKIPTLKLNEDFLKETLLGFYLEDDLVVNFFGDYTKKDDAYRINTSNHMFARVDV